MFLNCSMGENSFINYNNPSNHRQNIENILCVAHLYTTHTVQCW